MKRNFMKRFLLFSIAFVLTIISAVSVCAKNTLLYGGVYGDVNGDNKINIRDATAIRFSLVNDYRRMTKNDPIGIIGDNPADFNGDCKVDIRDVTDLQKMLAEQDYSYNHPYAVTKGNMPFDAIGIDANISSAKTFFYSPDIPADFKQGMAFKFIDSVKEYEEFFGKEIDEKYDDEFFREKSLLCIYYKYSENPFRDFGFSECGVKNNTLYLKLRYEKMDFAEDFYFWYSQNIPVEKTVVKDINEICVDIEENSINS